MPIQRKTTAQFVTETLSVHGDKYDYSEAEYVNTHMPVKINCMECGGVFLQEPSSHLAGHGCPKCNKKQTQRRVDQATFIARAKDVHGDKYDYSKVNIGICVLGRDSMSSPRYFLATCAVAPSWSRLSCM